MATADLTRVLDGAGTSYELLHHEHTEQALAEAKALGVSPRDVGKTLIVSTPTGYVRALVPAERRIDMRKLRDLLDLRSRDVHLASEEEMARDYSEFELGAVPPLGGSRRDPVVIDSELAAREQIMFEAGSHDDSVRLSTQDLIRLTDASIADIAGD
jgi:Ala-tRNA(Pro) deacylase